MLVLRPSQLFSRTCLIGERERLAGVVGVVLRTWSSLISSMYLTGEGVRSAARPREEDRIGEGIALLRLSWRSKVVLPGRGACVCTGSPRYLI